MIFRRATRGGTGSVEYGTPTLAAERGTGVEGVLRIRNHRWNGQFVAYRNQIDNYVYLLAQSDTLVDGHAVSVFRYVQDDATLQGLEASLEWAARNDLAVGVSGDVLHAEQRNESASRRFERLCRIEPRACDADFVSDLAGDPEPSCSLARGQNPVQQIFVIERSAAHRVSGNICCTQNTRGFEHRPASSIDPHRKLEICERNPYRIGRVLASARKPRRARQL